MPLTIRLVSEPLSTAEPIQLRNLAQVMSEVIRSREEQIANNSNSSSDSSSSSSNNNIQILEPGHITEIIFLSNTAGGIEQEWEEGEEEEEEDEQEEEKREEEEKEEEAGGERAVEEFDNNGNNDEGNDGAGNDSRESNVPYSRFDWGSSHGEIEHVEQFSGGVRFPPVKEDKKRRGRKDRRMQWGDRMKKMVKSVGRMVRWWKR